MEICLNSLRGTEEFKGYILPLTTIVFQCDFHSVADYSGESSCRNVKSISIFSEFLFYTFYLYRQFFSRVCVCV